MAELPELPKPAKRRLERLRLNLLTSDIADPGYFSGRRPRTPVEIARDLFSASAWELLPFLLNSGCDAETCHDRLQALAQTISADVAAVRKDQWRKYEPKVGLALADLVNKWSQRAIDAELKLLEAAENPAITPTGGDFTGRGATPLSPDVAPWEARIDAQLKESALVLERSKAVREAAQKRAARLRKSIPLFKPISPQVAAALPAALQKDNGASEKTQAPQKNDPNKPAGPGGKGINCTPAVKAFLLEVGQAGSKVEKITQQDIVLALSPYEDRRIFDRFKSGQCKSQGAIDCFNKILTMDPKIARQKVDEFKKQEDEFKKERRESNLKLRPHPHPDRGQPR